LLIVEKGQVKAVIGQGMPSYRHHDHGNLYIQFDVKFPPNYFNDIDKILALEQILPPRNPSGLPADVMDFEEVQLEEIDPSQQARAAGNAMEEDDEEHTGHGGDRVQCASQ